MIDEIHPSPRGRFDAAGPAALTDAELLAVLANLPNVAVAQQVIVQAGGLRGLSRAQAIPGISADQSAQIRAAVELARRIFAATAGQEPLRSPADAGALLCARIGLEPQEHFVVVCLDNKLRIVAIHTAYIGTVNDLTIRIGEVYREPVRIGAASIIIAHNHPSQDTTPSPSDIRVTRQIVRAGALLDIPCVDHLIVTTDSWASLRDQRLGFTR